MEVHKLNDMIPRNNCRNNSQTRYKENVNVKYIIIDRKLQHKLNIWFSFLKF